MTTPRNIASSSLALPSARGRVFDGYAFDAAVAALSAWFFGGLFLDGWAHTHGRVDSSFFTPWHAVLYSGHLAVFLLLLAALAVNRARGLSWYDALPSGYGLSLLGAVLWIPSGIGDLLWHTLFGIEVSVEALFSPTHLMLAFSGALVVSGPLRAAWRRSAAEHSSFLRQLPAPSGPQAGRGTAAAPRPDGAAPSRPDGMQQAVSQLPMLLSLAYTLSALTFFTQEANPIAVVPAAARPFTAPTIIMELSVIGMLWTAALLMGAVLLLLTRTKPVPGALTLIFLINAAAMGVLNDHYPLAHIAAFALAGLVADALIWTLKPSIARPAALRVFAFAVPACLYLFYFAASWWTGGLWWSVHVWTGVVFLAGLTSLLLTCLLL